MLLVADAIAVTVLMGVTALVAKRMGRVVIVDMMWGLGFVLIALVSAVVGDTPVRWLLLVMVAVWGCRLGWHTGRRLLATDDEDPRYATLLEGKPFSHAVVRVFLTQGVAMWFVSLPVQVAAASDQGWWASLAERPRRASFYLVGLGLETIGDRQLRRTRKGPGPAHGDGPSACGTTPATRTTSATPCVSVGHLLLVGVGSSRCSSSPRSSPPP